MNTTTNTIHPEVRLYLSRQGQAGGMAGRGERKRRGDFSYYQKIARKRWEAQRQTAHVGNVEISGGGKAVAIVSSLLSNATLHDMVDDKIPS